jgi:hypothetical protein
VGPDPDPANLRVELPEGSKYESAATDIEVELVKEKTGR